MTTRTTTDTRLRELSAYVRQLTEPLVYVAQGRPRSALSLLSQLRQAAEPVRAGNTGPRSGVPGSRLPIRTGPVDALSTIYVELSGWHARLKLTSPPAYEHGCEHDACRLAMVRRASIIGPVCARASLARLDWQVTVLRQLVGAWPTLDAGQQEWLYRDVESWWEMAARATGWTLTNLRRIR